MIFRFAAALLAFSPLLAIAQTAQKAPPPAPLVRVVLTTSLGAITLELDRGHAPITTANFLRYVDQRRFDGTVFYRTMKLGERQGLVQGGTQQNPKRVLKPIAHEPTNLTGIRHVAGTISMARWAPGTANGDFSILVSDMPALDANPGGSGDTAGYAAFGHVVEGMEVVIKLLDSPTSPTLGEGFMKGQMIAAPVRIVTARRAPSPVLVTPKP